MRPSPRLPPCSLPPRPATTIRESPRFQPPTTLPSRLTSLPPSMSTASSAPLAGSAAWQQGSFCTTPLHGAPAASGRCSESQTSTLSGKERTRTLTEIEGEEA
uniref:Uncharacterized protein n=1 Tax=Oryza barthii TaxID=65489 RepID=A0A0D3HG14_9ORYZ